MIVVGQRFGRLIVLGPGPGKSFTRMKWSCKCDCGNEVFVRANHLSSGATKSCGCLRDEKMRETGSVQHFKHGHNPSSGASRTYITWNNMINRCTHPNHDAFKHYGGRGITVCDAWLKDFRNFLTDMGEKTFWDGNR